MTKSKSPASARKPWLRPVVEKIAAGQAEVGTRNSNDSTFATS